MSVYKIYEVHVLRPYNNKTWNKCQSTILYTYIKSILKRDWHNAIWEYIKVIFPYVTSLLITKSIVYNYDPHWDNRFAITSHLQIQSQY